MTECLDARIDAPLMGVCPPAMSSLQTQSDYAKDLLALLPQHIEDIVFRRTLAEAVDLVLEMAAYTSMAEGVILARNDTALNRSDAALNRSVAGERAHSDTVVAVDIPSGHDPEFEQVLAGRVRAAAAELDRRGHGTSAFILDPVMVSEGIVAGPHVRLPAVIDAVHEAGGLYIANETHTSFFRTGDWWGFEALGAAPDLVIFSKHLPDVPQLSDVPDTHAAGGGAVVAAVAGPRVVFKDFAAVQPSFRVAVPDPAANVHEPATNVKEPATNEYFRDLDALLISAHAVLKNLQAGEGKTDLGADTGGRVAEAGQRLGDGIVDVLRAAGMDVQVRRAGLLVGVDFRRAVEIVDAMRQEGVLVSCAGPNDAVLMMRPSLVVTDAQIDRLIDAFEAALLAVSPQT